MNDFIFVFSTLDRSNKRIYRDKTLNTSGTYMNQHRLVHRLIWGMEAGAVHLITEAPMIADKPMTLAQFRCACRYVGKMTGATLQVLSSSEDFAEVTVLSGTIGDLPEPKKRGNLNAGVHSTLRKALESLTRGDSVTMPNPKTFQGFACRKPTISIALTRINNSGEAKYSLRNMAHGEIQITRVK